MALGAAEIVRPHYELRARSRIRRIIGTWKARLTGPADRCGFLLKWRASSQAERVTQRGSAEKPISADLLGISREKTLRTHTYATHGPGPARVLLS
jgi:hypothetical protein